MVQTKYDVPVRRAFRWASEQKFLESQLHGSRRKSYLSAPFFFHLRYGTHGYVMSAYEITAKFSQLQVI